MVLKIFIRRIKKNIEEQKKNKEESINSWWIIVIIIVRVFFLYIIGYNFNHDVHYIMITVESGTATIWALGPRSNWVVGIIHM